MPLALGGIQDAPRTPWHKVCRGGKATVKFGHVATPSRSGRFFYILNAAELEAPTGQDGWGLSDPSALIFDTLERKGIFFPAGEFGV